MELNGETGSKDNVDNKKTENSGEKPFVCQHCSKTFAQFENLKVRTMRNSAMEYESKKRYRCTDKGIKSYRKKKVSLKQSQSLETCSSLIVYNPQNKLKYSGQLPQLNVLTTLDKNPMSLTNTINLSFVDKYVNHSTKQVCTDSVASNMHELQLSEKNTETNTVIDALSDTPQSTPKYVTFNISLNTTHINSSDTNQNLEQPHTNIHNSLLWLSNFSYILQSLYK
ncbi:hypothetical protein PMAC_001308 [Pneumocystis sp. 'macacae']|nr:hypothetical protein PMAC_001308 [Pneumocystis sp. 'macacae']